MAKFLYELDRLTNNYPVQVARGRIENASPFGAFGKKIAIGAYNGILWPDGVFAFPASTGSAISLVSTSANDTAGGSGIRTMRIRYLDVNLDTKFEDVTLNGLTPVSTVANDIRYINGMLAVTYGAGKGAAGSITAFSGTGNHTVVPIGELRCTCSVRTVPRGQRFVITSIDAGSVSGTAATGCLINFAVSDYFGIDYSVNNLLVPYLALAAQDNHSGFGLDAPIAFTEGISVGMLCNCDKGATIVGSYHGWLEPI